MTKNLFASVVLGFSLLACSSDDDAAATSGQSPANNCTADNRKEAFSAGMSKPAGTLKIQLAAAAPAPPAKGTNELTIEVLDSAGNPVDGATVTVTPFMPDHGHGSAVVPIVAP